MDKNRKCAEHYGSGVKRLTPDTAVRSERAKQAVEEFIAAYPGLKVLADKNREEG